MPPPARVELLDAIDAVYSLFPPSLRNGEIPAYSDQFYKDVSNALNGKWTSHNVYINLLNDRRGLKTKVFEKLGISVEDIRRNIAESCNAIEPNIEPFDDNDSDDKSAIVETLGNDMFIYPTWSNDDNRFDLCILNKLWQEMKPVTRVYNGRQYLTLPPGVWSDIIADNFWKQYRMPCAFTFKKATVSLNPSRPFLNIIGMCKSSECDSKFQAIAEKEHSEKRFD